MSGVDRLALVSKIMLDQRFLELKRENERLKLSLFWVDHSINTLKHLTNYANNRAGGPRCFCRCCVRAKRYRPSILDGYDDEDSIVERACRFGPWFEKMLQEHGLTQLAEAARRSAAANHRPGVRARDAFAAGAFDLYASDAIEEGDVGMVVAPLDICAGVLPLTQLGLHVWFRHYAHVEEDSTALVKLAQAVSFVRDKVLDPLAGLSDFL